MTSARDVKVLVKPILERHSQFALAGRLLFRKPVRHVLRGMFIDGCLSKEWFKVFGVIDAPLGMIDSLSVGNVPIIFHDTVRWKLTVPDVHLAVLEVFESRILPLVDCITDLKHYEILMLSEETNADFVVGGRQAILVSMALGDLSRAALLAESTIAQLYSYHARLNDYERFKLNIIEVLHDMILRGDRAEISEHLHTLERRSVERLKIAHLHERTPFPIELM